MPKHNFTQSVNNGGVPISATESFLNGEGVEINETFETAPTNAEVALVLDVSEVTSLAIISTKDATLKTNDSGSPAQTITLTANRPVIWNALMPYDNPLTTDVTKGFFTCAVAGVNLKLIALVDATP